MIISIPKNLFPVSLSSNKAVNDCQGRKADSFSEALEKDMTFSSGNQKI